MPYKTNRALPDSVKNVLPAEAQTTWRTIYNSAAAQYGEDTERAFATAWSGLQGAGWEKDAEGAWSKVAKQHTGVWFGFSLPPDVAEALAQPGGEEAETLHVTLGYVAEATSPDMLQRLIGATIVLALDTPPIVGTLGGIGRFPASPSSDGKDVMVALVDSAALERLRARIRAVLAALGMPLSEAHGYSPHVTLRYEEPGMDGPLPTLEATTVVFPAVVIRHGEGNPGVSIPFAGTSTVARGTLAKHGPRDGDLADETPWDLVWTIPIAKAEDTKRRVFGWGSVVVTKEGETLVDLQGDVIDITDLEEAMYGYVAESRMLTFDHAGAPRGTLIESMVFTPDKISALGIPEGALPLGAWLGFEIATDADYQLVKERGLLMFSIEGRAVPEEVMIE